VHVANICFGCFKGTLQVFCIGVAKVDRDIPHVAMLCMFQMFHICCKCFHLDVAYTCMWQAYVSSVSSRCCIYCNGFHVFLQVFRTHVSSVSSFFFLYVATVASECFKSRSGCSTCLNDYACMFRVYVPNVSSISDVCCKCFHVDISK
jgi:hypothetical protein